MQQVRLSLDSRNLYCSTSILWDPVAAVSARFPQDIQPVLAATQQLLDSLRREAAIVCFTLS